MLETTLFLRDEVGSIEWHKGIKTFENRNNDG